MNDLTHVDLFSGIGGFSLAAGWAGFRTVAFCEIEPFCQEVLKARFNATPDTTGKRLGGGSKDGPRKQSGVSGEDIQADGAEARFGAVADAKGANNTQQEREGNSIREVVGRRKPEIWLESGGYNDPLLIPDIFALDGTRFRGATLLTGGFPCQPFSHAGKRRGKEDDRHLWPEMLRVIHEARPAWVLGENVSGLISMELDQVLADLELEGYACRTFHIGAVGVNAPHRRMRVWIVANSGDRSGGTWGIQDPGENPREMGQGPSGFVESADSDAPDAAEQGLSLAGLARVGELPTESGTGVHHRPKQSNQSSADPQRLRCQVGGRVGDGERMGQEQERPHAPEGGWDIPWIEVASRLCGLDDELSPRLVGYLGITEAHLKVRDKNRVQKLKALGNAIVPAVAFQIIAAIREIELGNKT